MEIGTDDDRSAIKSMFAIGGVFHAIKERGIYVIRLADEIDPGRTNPSLPNTQQRVLAYGSDSELVGRTLLTAKNLFNSTYLPKSFDHERALVLAFDALKDLAAMQGSAADYQKAETEAIADFESQQQTQGALALPAIGDTKSRCKTFAQKADHASGALHKIAKLFYKASDVGTGFSALAKFAERKYGKDDPFTKFLVAVVPFMTFIRETRDCLEHEHSRQDQKCIVTDFTLAHDCTIVRPTIEVRYRKAQYPAEPVLEFMVQVNGELPKVIEMMMAYMCSKHVQFFGGLPIQVVELPEHQRGEKYVRFSYGLYQGAQVVPAS